MNLFSFHSLGVKGLILVLLSLIGISAQGTECLGYSTNVTLEGRLIRRTFPEQPNYESVAKGDAQATYFFILPRKPFCVSQGNESEPGEAEVKQVQLVFSAAKNSYRQLRSHLGKEVMCSGHFFHAISGHHHSAVLLEQAQCRPSQTAR